MTPERPHRSQSFSMALQHVLTLFVAFLAASCLSEPEPDWVRPMPQIETLPESRPGNVSDRDPTSLALSTTTPASPTPAYRIGPGDGLDVRVVGHPDLSGAHRVGPDGAVALPLAGALTLHGQTREGAADLVREALQKFFLDELDVSVSVTEYENNKAYVLGRVERPGVVDLTGAGTLLQALAEAGGLPVREFRSFLAQCSIIRGRDQILWIDLIELLQGGNVALNVPLQNGDVVFIPDSEDAIVYVMGEVNSPGAVPIKVRIDLIQALAHAGGTTEYADLEAVYVVRRGKHGNVEKPVRVDVRRLVETGDFGENVELKTGDVVFVARNGMGDLNYVLRTLQPAVSTLTLGAALQ